MSVSESAIPSNRNRNVFISFFDFEKTDVPFHTEKKKQPMFHICTLLRSLFPFYVFFMGKNIA